MSVQKLTIVAVVYPGFEMLDLFGPLEMFSLAGAVGSEAEQGREVGIVITAETEAPVPAAMARNVTQ